MILSLYECFRHWSMNRAIWLYSDPHFSDKDLPNWISDEEQIKKINSKVGRKDTLIILGDIGNLNCVKKLRGYKVLIAGNHDTGVATKYKREIHTRIFNAEEYTKDEALLKMKEIFPNCSYEICYGYNVTHSPFEYWSIKADNKLFDEIYSGPLMIGEKILLSHEPVNIPWAFNIHGHIHDIDYKMDETHLNCCSNIINYTPINLKKIITDGKLAKVKTLHTLTKERRITNGNVW